MKDEASIRAVAETRKLIREAFIAGFNSSAEGFNGEYATNRKLRDRIVMKNAIEYARKVLPTKHLFGSGTASL